MLGPVGMSICFCLNWDFVRFLICVVLFLLGSWIVELDKLILFDIYDMFMFSKKFVELT